jgi:hypothetical protein
LEIVFIYTVSFSYKQPYPPQVAIVENDKITIILRNLLISKQYQFIALLYAKMEISCSLSSIRILSAMFPASLQANGISV